MTYGGHIFAVLHLSGTFGRRRLAPLSVGERRSTGPRAAGRWSGALGSECAGQPVFGMIDVTLRVAVRMPCAVTATPPFGITAVCTKLLDVLD